MNIILLSGGSGKRLWPLSNEVRSKQFLKILRGPGGVHESMLQYIYRNLAAIGSTASQAGSSVADATGSSVSEVTSSQTTVGYVPAGNQENGQQDRHGQERQQRPVEITIATSANQVSSIRSQLGDAVGISIEPCRRDTFPAIALATAYLHDIRGVGRDEAVVVCPVDPYVEPTYFKVIADMYDLASGNSMAASKGGETGKTGIVLMGIAPTYPSAKYGYIIPASTENVSAVSEFKEKPDVPTAEKYIAAGAMWNGGVFAFKLSYLLNKAQSLLGCSSYNDLLANYAALPKISFDYAVVEKEPNVTVIRYAGAWKDLGTWNTLTEAMSEPVSGNAVAPLSINTHVINELQIPLIALGVRDLAIAATPDGILITDKKSSDKLKDYVTDNRPMYEKRLWGEYKVLDMFASSLPAAMTADSVSSPAHGSETADKVGVNNPVNNCVYTHSEAVKAGDNAGKDRAVISSNADSAVNSADAVVAAQLPVGNSTGEKTPSGQESCPNIQTIKGPAKKINTVNPVVINTDERFNHASIPA